METFLRDFVAVVTVAEKSEERLLVRTPQVTVICAITELMMMDTDFTLLLLGLRSFTNLIAVITESKPKRIAQRDFDTLMNNQSGDGYCWIFHLATNFLRIALSDPKRLIRTAGSQLVAKLLHLPGGSRSIVRNAALDCLAVAVKQESGTLIYRVESQLPILNRNNSAKREEKEGEQEELSIHQTAASLRSIVFQRPLPSLNSQSRLVRPPRLDSTVKMSAVGQFDCESSSSIGERRKPSAGRMHGNLPLPWDPRESVVVVGSATGPSRSCPISLPNLSQSSNATLDRNFNEPRSSGRSPQRSVSNQNPGNQSLDLYSRAEIRRSLNLSGAFYCKDNQAAAEAQMGVAYESSDTGSAWVIPSSLAISPSTSENCVVGNRKLMKTIEPSEASRTRRKSSQRRSLRVNTDLDLTNLQLSDQLDTISPNTHRSFNRLNCGSNPCFLTPPSIPSSLSTSRAGLPQHHQSPKFDQSSSCGKISNSPTDCHTLHAGPLRGQHELAKNMMLPSPDCNFQYPQVDVVGRSMHPFGDFSRTSIKPDGSDADGRNDNGGDYNATNESGRKAEPSSSPESDDDDSTLRTGIEGHAPRGFGRRSSRSRQGDNVKSASSQRERRGDFGDLDSARNGPQTPTRTPSLQRPPHGVPTRRPPTGPRDGSLQRRSIRQRSPDSASREATLSRLSQNHPSMNDLGKCRDVTSALNQIESADWEDKVDGLLSLSTLALKHPTAFSNSPDTYSAIIHVVTSECRNLRSQVSRQAVKTIADLFRGLGRLLDPHVDTCVRVLLAKTGEASAAFLRGEVAIALSDLVRSVNPNRALIALFQHGLGRVLQAANQRGNLSSWGSMTTVCGGAASTPSLNASATGVSSASSQAITERVIVALGKFLLDSNQETRYYGRRILATLQQSPDFERALTRYLSGQMLRAVREAIDYLHAKGLGEPPTSVVSAICPRTMAASEQVDASLQNRGCSAGSLGGL
ncbi:protein FAM179B [Echinococcus multilocularis]|uniref:Protein FAM179B n=1 Tax=Echinococcus multilocularis TaxID=6211 RepID=A0A087VWI3_ECHMU|nr:protein FAM179B [Echinococcus multilocularis]